LSSLERLTKKSLSNLSATQFIKWLNTYLEIKKDITIRIQNTRAKDYANPFRKMVYENEAEMNAVIGSIADNSFIKEQKNVLIQLETKLAGLKKELK
jgi:predicted neuraminidase